MDLYRCPDCNGDGKETCHNPDHGFIYAIGGEIGRLGCPVCGHDENYKVKNGGNCESCKGIGKLTYEQIYAVLICLDIDDDIDDYKIEGKEDVKTRG